MLDRINRMLASGTPPPRRLRRIVIVGGGLTGAMAAISIADAVKEPLELVIFAADGPLGGGVAYGKSRPDDILNVRARDLSVHPQVREDFAEWLTEETATPVHGPAYDALCESFAPRAVYGAYVRQRLGEAVRRAPLLRLVVDRREAVAITPLPIGGYRVECAEGEPVLAGVVLLATGYGSARPRFGVSAYDPSLGERLAAAKSMTVVGSGLSMVDVLLWARREGWDGQVDILSRHGLVPLPHAPLAVRPPAYQTAGGGSVTKLLQRLRAGAAIAAAEGRPWQGEVNRLRPHAQEIWRALPIAEQRRFLRHARRLWDIHRHRVPAPVYRTLMTELGRERTTLHRGAVRGVSGDGPYTVDVAWCGGGRRGTRGSITSDLVVDCTGFAPAVQSPLVQSLVASGVAELDPHGMGLSVASDGRVLPGSLRGEPDLFALGPLGQGSLFEITAAPEIIQQVRQAAAAIRDLFDLDETSRWPAAAPVE